MEFNINIWDEVVKWLHENGKFTPEMLTEEPARNLIGETNRILSDAVHLSITEEVPPELTAQLEQNTYVFSAFKGFHNLKEASLKLTNENGGIKPFETFKQDVLKVHKTYNVNYLESEYNFAVQSAQMAVKWADYVADGDRYYLQYRTAGDGKVRAEHTALHGITLPVDDPFWDKYFPPLGWNCRCTAVQVRKDKYPVSDSTTAIQAGENATSGAKQQIFRFNPGKEGKIFPPKHPYLPKGCEGCKKNSLRLAYNSNRTDCKMCVDFHNEGIGYKKVETDRGNVYVHENHGKVERINNIKTASYFANKYEQTIKLLPPAQDKESPDVFNETLNITQEYKHNSTGNMNSIDHLLRKAGKQSEHVVLSIPTQIDFDKLARTMNNRVRRNDRITDIWIYIPEIGEDKYFTREEIIKNDFKIKWE